MQWIYLSKNGTDEYINRFAAGDHTLPTPIENWQYDIESDRGLVLRGIMKHKIMKRCWQDKRAFRYMDTGYFGNKRGVTNPSGYKVYHRVVPNDLQHNQIIDRPSDRWQRLRLETANRRKSGHKIVIAAPDEKPCEFYGIDLDSWINDVTTKLMSYTDRPIVLRQRAKNVIKTTRDNSNTFLAAISDAWAVVTYNSTAAVESVMHGVPVFVLAPCNAALPVANTDLADIENPSWPDDDLRYKWYCHLAYGQFHNRELENGTAKWILDNEF